MAPRGVASIRRLVPALAERVARPDAPDCPVGRATSSFSGRMRQPAERVTPAARPWIAYLVVFVASGCTLVLELVAGRILAPFVGVSIHTWTSIIGGVLAGISLGNYLGGVLADRVESGRTLGILLGAGGWRASRFCRWPAASERWLSGPIRTSSGSCCSRPFSLPAELHPRHGLADRDQADPGRPRPGRFDHMSAGSTPSRPPARSSARS